MVDINLREPNLLNEPGPFQNRNARNQKQHNWDELRGWGKNIAKELTNVTDELSEEMNDFLDRYNDQIAGNTDLSEMIDARRPLGKQPFKTVGARLNAMDNERITIKSGEFEGLITLQDDKFSKNHLVIKESVVESDYKLSGLIIAEIDNVKQDTFYLKKVGEI